MLHQPSWEMLHFNYRQSSDLHRRKWKNSAAQIIPEKHDSFFSYHHSWDICGGPITAYCSCPFKEERRCRRWRWGFMLQWAIRSLLTCVSGRHSTPPNIHRVEWEAGRTYSSQDGDVMSALDCKQSDSCSAWTPGTLPLSVSSPL